MSALASPASSQASEKAREQRWEAELEKMELVAVTYIVDAITFWAQNVTEDRSTAKIEAVLSETCPTASRLSGRPCPQKFYGACFTEDRCWYRCKVLQQLDDKFQVSYVDYGNTEFVSRSDLVELPDKLQSPALAKKYKFWSFRLASEQDSPHYLKGKSFLQNLIYGKKLRINKKSVCFDGTILVQAFQGNLDIGEEVLKFKFAKVSLPGNRESILPGTVSENQPALWPWSSQGDSDNPSFLTCIPKLRPVFSNPKPQASKEVTANVPAADGEPAKEKNLPEEDVIQPLCSQYIEQMLNETKLELQKMKLEVEQKEEEIEKLKEEKTDIQKHADHLEQQLQEARLQLQKVTKRCETGEKSVEVQLDLSIDERFSQLYKKVEAVRKFRESNSCSTAENHLWESITTVMNNRTVTPLTLEQLEVAWDNYNLSLQKLRGCQSKGELEDLVNSKNQTCTVLLAAIDEFLLEVDSMPISERLKSLKEVVSLLMGEFGSASADNVEDQSFEQFCEWKKQKTQNARNVRLAADDALYALRVWAVNSSKFFCLTEKTDVTLEAVAEGVDVLLKEAEFGLCEELNINEPKQDGEAEKIMSSAFIKVMQHVQDEEQQLCDIGVKYELSKNFRQEMLKWQNCTPKTDKLLGIKKDMKCLRSQLRWKQVEVGCLEEADELDLPEIVKKKEEIAEIRNSLFQEIKHEQEEYIKLCELVKGNFPELVYLYPEADISSYMSSEGLLMKSLDRDLFDAEPMRELSGRRPLVCTEFQGQKVVLKGYAVNEKSEVRMLEQAAQYRRAQSQSPTTIAPLLALFFGKSDPLAYAMVPYFSNGSLSATQRISPLLPSEIQQVMRGVLQGLQSLHAADITHASLNPNNVFILNREQGIVGDYDFTKAADQRAVDSAMVAGSVCLVAPELKQGHPPSPASDMYAFGGLMLWLHAPDFSGAVENFQQVPEFSGLQLDVQVQTLLSKVLVKSGRLAAFEALNENYFISL